LNVLVPSKHVLMHSMSGYQAVHWLSLRLFNNAVSTA